MKDFSTWSAATDPRFLERKLLASDLDDTLTEAGALPAAVVAALENLQARGWLTLLVTGRSAGWVDAMIKLLPFDAIVGENGAFLSLWPARKSQRAPREEPRKLYWSPQGFGSSLPAGLRSQWATAEAAILKAHPRARVASDQPYRLYDLAIDFAEEVDPPLSLAEAEAIKTDFEKLGATARVSSIHVNGWWGSFSKVEGLRQIVEKNYGLSLEGSVLYMGDSPNDAPLFESGALSIGVANVRDFSRSPGFVAPAYVTQGRAAKGALEVLRHLAALAPR